MNRKEVAALVAYVTQLAPAQNFDEYTAAAWWDVLGDLDATFEQAREATAKVAKEQQWIYPSAIREKLLPILAAANPPAPAAARAIPGRFDVDEDRAERALRGGALVRQAIAEAKKPYSVERATSELSEKDKKLRQALINYRAEQARRDNAMKLGRVGGQLMTQISKQRASSREGGPHGRP